MGAWAWNFKFAGTANLWAPERERYPPLLDLPWVPPPAILPETLKMPQVRPQWA